MHHLNVTSFLIVCASQIIAPILSPHCYPIIIQLNFSSQHLLSFETYYFIPVYSLFMSPSGQDKLHPVKNFVFLHLCYIPSTSKGTGIQQALDEYKIKSFFLTFCVRVCVCKRRKKRKTTWAEPLYCPVHGLGN